MASKIIHSLSIILILLCLTLSVSGIGAAEQTTVLFTVSEVCIEADDSLKILGYTVNGEKNLEKVIVSYKDTLVIDVLSLPAGMELKTTVVGGDEFIGSPLYLGGFPQDEAISITLQLSLTGTPTPSPIPPVNPVTPSNPTDKPPVLPEMPDKPNLPDTPSDPEHPDTPGSDEPLVPILPPADSVYNFAGFIPLVAGFLLLFLVFFWRRKVYRILKSHAKKHGEKPEKEHLKEIADAIIKLVRDEGRYPEWKKNSDVAKRLSADIVSVLDEMNYPKAVPRGALVTEIIKAARGRINRHRL